MRGGIVGIFAGDLLEDAGRFGVLAETQAIHAETHLDVFDFGKRSAEFFQNRFGGGGMIGGGLRFGLGYRFRNL